ncbi:mechanosensitive ion channel [archaeon]|jgi:small conductance mechanosensitive channel|nr:mechanosensitive ion channel [archaeon]MBT4273150.1 mechanosensitive ion channel [archaeon]MBT4461371.1 mechanosensitive ion channel [archaeon]MBT4858883.1 mechanosensitive ion channel [archaeon]MBT5423453.1 mechanosensitive ion channel [archaeon]
MYQIAIDPVSVFTNLNQNLLKMGFAILIFLVGFILGNISGKLLYKFLKEIEVNSILKNLTGLKLNLDHLISNIISYAIYFLALVAALEQLGIANIILYLLSAAVIIVILVSFFIAIRDFIPNLIAGFYLYSKEKLKDGCKIEVEDIKGTLLHVDLLHVRIKTKNGDIIYIPNSKVIKSKIKIK